MTELQIRFSNLIGNIKYLLDEPMSRHTSFKIGGPSEIMVFPKDSAELAAVLKLSQNLDTKPAVLGAGTNVLAPDAGVHGIVICLKECLEGIFLVDDCRIRVMAGVTMTRAAVFAANHGLAGMEFAHGIPGSVGGGVYMNAGAYGGEICQICECVEVMDPDGTLHHLTCDQMKFSYRHSVLEENGGIVVSATFRLVPGNEEDIKAHMKELMSKRSASQPLQLPSAGSAFKRPVGGYAAALIDQTGLKGFRIGDAAVSEKHAGFVVNLGSATAADVCALLDSVSDQVYSAHGIRLEPEVRIW